MTENKFRFTDDRLKKLQSDPEKERSYFYDLQTTGLRLQVTSAGTKSFQFQTWDTKRKKPVTRTLGKYPALSIINARIKAVEMMNEVNSNIDIENEAAKFREEDTFDIIFSRWLDQFAKPHKRSWKEDERRYKLYFERPFGKKKISWFTQARVRAWHNAITKKTRQRGEGDITPATANRSLALLSTVFNQILPEVANPCKGVKKFAEESRDRFLQPEELKRFFAVLYDQNTPDILRDYVLLSMFTGGRRSNILSMRWKEISFERQLWSVPAAKSKNAAKMDIPLIPDAIEILGRRKSHTSSVFVFPGSGKTGHYAEPKTAWRTLIKRTGLDNIRIHDLRRTLGSWQTMTGASSTIVGKTLGHKSPEATAVYARMNLDPVRASMETAVEAMKATRDLPEKIVKINRSSNG